MRSPVFISVRPDGRTVEYTKTRGRWERANPIEVDAKITGTDLLLIAGGVAAFGLVGYLLWVSMQDAQAAAGDGGGTVGAGTPAGGNVNAPTVLGSGGSLTPLGGASGASYGVDPNVQPIGEVARAYGTVPVLPTIGPSFP